MKASNNYLALRDQNGTYYLNGNWRIDYPQKMDVCGTTFHYERKYKNTAAKGPLTLFAPESVRALGPTTCSLFIVVSVSVYLLTVLITVLSLAALPRGEPRGGVRVFSEEGHSQADSHWDGRWVLLDPGGLGRLQCSLWGRDQS